jgi:hypothetical protein
MPGFEGTCDLAVLGAGRRGTELLEEGATRTTTQGRPDL